MATSSQNVSIRLELPDSAPASSPITGRLLITNIGDETISLVTPLYNAALNLAVFDKYWNLVVPNSLGKAHLAYDHIEIAPNQSVTLELEDLIYTSGTARFAYKLDQGVYYVIAIYHPGTERLPDRSSYPSVFVSNVCRITVN